MQLTSTHWGTYHYKTENGKVTALTPFDDDAHPTPIGQGILDVLDDETRITQPMVRQSWLEGRPGHRQTNKRGSDRFVAIDLSLIHISIMTIPGILTGLPTPVSIYKKKNCTSPPENICGTRACPIHLRLTMCAALCA